MALSFNFISILIFLTVHTSSLSPNFYDASCPSALTTVANITVSAVTNEPRMGASLIRLHFHDCFVQGCDASILLDDTPSFVGEKTAAPNINSARGFEVIEAAKSALEKQCPQTVSCADILAIAARDSSAALGGPSWTVKLGRRDSKTANKTLAETEIPSFKDSIYTLIARFGGKGLNERDLVALSGAHTIGQAHCVNFRDRIYRNGTDIDLPFAAGRRLVCPSTVGNGDNNLSPLDLRTPNLFDNKYYENLIENKSLLDSDNVLRTSASTASIVLDYAVNGENFHFDFSEAVVKMGDINPLTGSDGQIRKICSKVLSN